MGFWGWLKDVKDGVVAVANAVVNLPVNTIHQVGNIIEQGNAAKLRQQENENSARLEQQKNEIDAKIRQQEIKIAARLRELEIAAQLESEKNKLEALLHWQQKELKYRQIRAGNF
jgi:hypothetical protein